MQSVYPADYFDARKRFRLEADHCGASLEQHFIRSRGPKGEKLSIDVAHIGSDRPDRTFVLSSGLHGVEGYLGSAIQTRVMQEHLDVLGANDRLVLIHALNPYGFAHIRRVNEDNVDLNRNFTVNSKHLDVDPESYRKLDAFLNPRQVPSRFKDKLFHFYAYRMVRKYGMNALRQAIAEGQYRFPKGLFYGGNTSCESTEIVKRHLKNWVGDARFVVHLDIHTGLGKSGGVQLLIDNQYSADSYSHFAKLANNPDITINRHDASGGAYTASGTLAKWCKKLKSNSQYLFACAEFGTYGSIKVLRALRNENLCHHWSRTDSGLWYNSKRELKECFFPKSRRWQERAISNGLSLIDIARMPL